MGPNCLQEYSRELTNYCLPLFDLTVCRLAGEEWLLTGEQQDEYYPEIGVVSYYITVEPVLVVTSIKQPTCIKQPEESCPKIHRLVYLNCIKQPPAFSSHILSFPWVAA